MQSISRLLRHFKMGQPRMGSTEWASTQRRGTAGCHVLSRCPPGSRGSSGREACRQKAYAAHGPCPTRDGRQGDGTGEPPRAV